MCPEKNSESKLSTSHSKGTGVKCFALFTALPRVFGNQLKGLWIQQEVSGTELHSGYTEHHSSASGEPWEGDTVTHYKLIPVGIPQYSCTVIVFILTENCCSATLVCYFLGTDKEPVQLSHLTKTCRVFTSPASLTQKTPLGGVTHRWLLHVFQPKCPNLKKKIHI